MKTFAVILLMIPLIAGAQSVPDPSLESPDLPDGAAGTPGRTDVSSPVLDSLARRLAILAVARAREEAASSDFWHRLMPRVSVEGGVGVRDIAFPDASGTIVLPKDSYRLTLSMPLSSLLEGSVHARAELGVAESETRFAMLLQRQALARRALERKKRELEEELAVLREVLVLRGSVLACLELLFAQGRADFRALAGSKVELTRLRHDATRLALRIREIDETLAGGTSP